jgi:hypothetical protein
MAELCEGDKEDEIREVERITTLLEKGKGSEGARV